MKSTILSTTGGQTSVFIVDGNAAAREEFKTMLAVEPDILVVGGVSPEPDALKEIALACPDIVVLALQVSGSGGMELIREIHRLVPPVQLVVVAAKMVLQDAFRLLQAGVKGYILAESVDCEMAIAIRTVSAGRRFLSPTVSNALVDDYVKKSASLAGPKDPLLLLNMREKEILQLVVEGKGSGIIADILNLSVSTVNTYRSRVMKKLGLRDITELVRFAIRNGLTPLSSCQSAGENGQR